MISTVILAAQLALAATSGHGYTVQPGDTLSGIAQAHGASLSAIEQANPAVTNPDVIYVGQSLNLVGSAGASVDSTTGGPATQPAQPVPSGSLSDVPGVPSGFAACVALRESSNGTNAAYNGGVYGIIRASGINVNGQSLAAQKAAFSQLYAAYGTAPWTPSDHC